MKRPLKKASPKPSATERPSRGCVVVLVTCATRREGLHIARRLVERRLAACVNVFETPVRSVYRWKGKIEQGSEFLVLIKSSEERLAALQAEVERLHSYDIPEFIALPIVGGSRSYLSWLGDCLLAKS
jgi:periplasmic divalent cation tolerance protein